MGGAQPGDEGPVDLQAMDRQLGQVGERRVPDAEVVDGQAHPDALKPFEDLVADRAFGHDHALGDLHREGRGGEPGRHQHPLDALREVRVFQLAARHVDRHVDGVVTLGPPGRALGTRLGEDPFADLDD